MPKPITIIGGGLAGLTLGIGLRRLKIPVAIHEAGSYPRHRVCGEFISGRGQQSLARLGLSGVLDNAGAVPAKTVAFFTAKKSSPAQSLPADAICLSRFSLDQALAQHFTEIGGKLITNQRSREDIFPEGVIRAIGRRAQTTETGPRWFALKVHAQNVSLAADLELHFLAWGYVGICQLADGRVNICGLFRRPPNINSIPQDFRQLLRGEPGSILNQRLASAKFLGASFCATAGLSLRPVRASARPEICLGDSITMIPPLTGNGMSMAFESAEIAIAPLIAWSQDHISWLEARQRIAANCDNAFAKRLKWAQRFQSLLLTPTLQSPLISLITPNRYFLKLAFELTR